MTRTGIPLAALLLDACTEALPRAPSAVVVVSPPIASSASAAAEGAPAESLASPEPRAVALPDVTACLLTTTQWRGATPKSELRVRAGGPVFATVRSGNGSLHLPVGKAADGAILEIADKALAVRGHLAASDVWLHAGKPLVLGDAVIPLGTARLEWTSSKPGAAGVAFDPHEGIALAQPPLAADLPCDAISLDSTSIDEMAALPGVAKTGKEGLLRSGHAVPLATTAGGAVIATLTAKAGEDARISVLGAAGPSTRILWTREDSAIFGWVPTAELEFPKQLPPKTGFGTGSGSGTLSGTHSLFRAVCAADVTAVVEVAGERWMVGRILAGTKIHGMGQHGEYRSVIVHGGGISTVVDAALMVKEAQIADCPRVP